MIPEKALLVLLEESRKYDYEAIHAIVERDYGRYCPLERLVFKRFTGENQYTYSIYLEINQNLLYDNNEIEGPFYNIVTNVRSYGIYINLKINENHKSC